MIKRNILFIILIIIAITVRLTLPKPCMSPNSVTITHYEWRTSPWGCATSPDSFSYLQLAQNILCDFRFINPTRTPVYPIFLVINFCLFGYMNLQAVAFAQFLLGILSVLMVYFLMLYLTKSKGISFLAGLLMTCNYRLMIFETYILTESLSVCVMLIVVCAFLWAMGGQFNIKRSIVLSLAILTLIFLRPNFIYLIILAPVIVLIYAFDRWSEGWHEGKARPLTNFLLPFIVIVIAPFIVWCFAIKSNYGFFGISNVGHIDLFGLILEENFYRDAPPEYSDIVTIIDTKMGTLAPINRTNPYQFIDDVQALLPHYCEADFSGVGQFSFAIIARHPIRYSQIVLRQMPIIFSYTSGFHLISNLKVGLSPIENKGFLVKLVHRTHNFLLYKFLLFTHNAIVYAIFLTFVFISIMLVLPFLHYDFQSWLSWTIIVTTLWGAILLVMCVSYGDFQRYRVPVDSLLLMMGCYFFYRILGARE